MKLYKTLTGLFIGILLFGVATAASADDPPPKSANSLPRPTETPSAQKSSVNPVPLQKGAIVLDPATGRIIHTELLENNGSRPAFPVEETVPITPKSDAPVHAPTLIESEGKILAINPNRINEASNLLMGSPAQGGIGGQGITAASSTIIMFEDFEGGFGVGGGWDRNDPTGHYWDDVDCFPVEGGGTRSAWAADDFSSAAPCSSNYVNDMNSWLEYGPFSLADAQSASLDILFRMDIEECDPIDTCDFFFWGASTDGANYLGFLEAGTHTGGPFQNGYNLASLDLSYLAGQPQVWIIFAFVSDSSITRQGPFIDLVLLRKNVDPRTLLVDENFDIDVFPNPAWESVDVGGTGHRWDDVGDYSGSNCPSQSGYWSMWPADDGANGLDPCKSSPDVYPDSMTSFLIHGPFDLTGASEAWTDFNFRNVSESSYDFFCWGASTNGYQFYGPSCNSGAYISGPHRNGYNLMRLNLANVNTLGDLRGAPEVWLAFVFASDSSYGYQGPFLDDVRVAVERPGASPGVGTVYLPIIFKAPSPVVPKTNLWVQNNTQPGANATYTIKNPRWEGATISDITCSIPYGAKVFCGSFDAGTYTVRSSSPCGAGEGSRTFPQGDYDLSPPLHCVN